MKVFVIAGEVSGDALGGALMQGLKAEVPGVSFDGVGGPLMQAEGLASRFDMSELSLMGLVEVLPKYFHLKRRIAQTAQAVLDLKPDVLITIDSPDFCLRVAKIVKAQSDIRCVHYVAPSVWAWRPKRAQKMAKVIDHVLALLPFEPPYMEAAGMACDFVGHPITTQPQATKDEAAAFRARTAPEAAPLILALPGSRRGEVSRLAPTFGAALHKLLQTQPNAHIVLPAAAPIAPLVREMAQDWPAALTILDPTGQDPETFAAEKRAAFKAADLALAASGTVSLELAAAATPMVIAYDMNRLSRALIQRMLQIDTVTLVNLVSDTRAVPEFIGARCTPELIAQGMADVLAAPDAQTAAMHTTMERLGAGGLPPGHRAAKAVLERR